MPYIGKSPTAVPLSASDLDDDIISLAKLASGTDGNLITYDASGNPVAVATGDDGQILTSAGAGQPCAFEAAAGGGGKVLQVVQNFWTTQESTTSTLGTFAIMTDSITAITPASTSNKILFIGTIQFSLCCLERLIRINSNVVGVCTKKTSLFNNDYADLSPICELNSIPCLNVENLNSKENIEWINNLNPDVIFCFGWSSLISKEILSIPPLGVVGYHPAKLPENRGRHPLIWALLMGLEKSTSTFFFMSEGIDDGEILSQVDFPILYEDDAQSLYDKVTGVALEQIENFVPKLKNNDYKVIDK